MVASAALVVMMLLTSADVFMRYLFNRPITGTYDVVGLLGAVLAAFAMPYTMLKKGHVAVEILVQSLSRGKQLIIETFTHLLGISLFLVLVWQAILLSRDMKAAGEVTPTCAPPLLSHRLLHGGLFFRPLPCHSGQSAARLDEESKRMNPIHIGIIGIVFLVAILFSKFPVAFCMALVGLLGFGYLVSPEAALNIIIKDFYTVFSSYDLTVVPLFVFMGQILFYAGISRKLYDAALAWFGHYKGGLAMATVGACAGFASICGSTNATAATMASVTLPEMKRLGYSDALATGTVAAGGSLGILIPPSTIFIVYGIMTEQSIGKLFMAGVLPGILLSILFMVTIYIWVTLRPEIAPRVEKAEFQNEVKGPYRYYRNAHSVRYWLWADFFSAFSRRPKQGP